MELPGSLKARLDFATQAEAEAGVRDDVACSPLNVAQSIAANPSTGGLEKTVVGAVGDGVADDTTALQTALSGLQYGETLNGQGKHYKVTSTLVIPRQAHLKIKNFRITFIGDIEGFIVDTGMSGTLYAEMLQFEDMFLIAHGHTTTGRRLITYTRNSFHRFSNIRTWGTSGKTVHWYGTGNTSGTGPYYGLWLGCSGLDGLAGIYMENVEPAYGVNSCQIRSCRMSMGSGGVGVYIGANSQNIVVDGCIFEHPTGGTGVYTAGDATLIMGCRFENLGTDISGTATVLGNYHA